MSQLMMRRFPAVLFLVPTSDQFIPVNRPVFDRQQQQPSLRQSVEGGWLGMEYRRHRRCYDAIIRLRMQTKAAKDVHDVDRDGRQHQNTAFYYTDEPILNQKSTMPAGTAQMRT